MSENQPEALPRPGTSMPFAGRINKVSTTEPWQWLARGWSDLRRACQYPGLAQK